MSACKLRPSPLHCRAASCHGAEDDREPSTGHRAQLASPAVLLLAVFTCDQLHKDAANAPDVGLKAPAQPQNDLWRSIVARADYGAVVLILEGGAAKVNDLDLIGGGLPGS